MSKSWSAKMNQVAPNDIKPSNVEKKPSLIWSVRFLFSAVMGLCYLVVYMQRINMSFAVVCMVNSTAVLELDASDGGGDGSQIAEINSTCAEISGITKNSNGKFVWSKADQGLILSAFFYGYILTQVLGGWFALKFGGLLVIGVSTILSSIITMVMVPIANLDSIPALFVLRFLIGFLHGFVLPALSFMFVRWAPPSEKSTLVGFATAWTHIGSVVSTLLGSYLCEFGFLEGWGSIFILFGAFGVVVVLLMALLTTESPVTHRFISENERNYIMERIPNFSTNKKVPKTPWKAIFTSRACYAIFITHFCLNWGAYLFLTQTPTYLKEVLQFDIRSNGLNSSIPYLASFLANLAGGFISDKIIKMGLLSRTNSRKLFNSLGMFVPLICSLLLGFIVDCTQPAVGVVLLSIGVGFMGLVNSGGYGVNAIDVAGQYAGVLYGISNTFATIPGIVAPYLVGLMTPKGTKEEWRVVFIITAVVYLAGGLPYVFMARGELEEWAKDAPSQDENEKNNKKVELNELDLKE